MKRKLLLLLALMAIGLSGAWAYRFSAVAPSGQTLYYNIVDGNAEVTSQNSSYPYYSTYPFYSTYPTGALVIPSTVTYNGTTYSVTSIGGFAFYYCSGLTSVTIGNSVTSIGENAFYDCSGLTSVTIPNSVTSIGSSAFYYCSGLTSVTIGNSVTSIGNHAFYNCSGLTSVTIGNSVTSIGNYAFEGCSNVDTLYYNARNLTTTSEWGNSSSSYNSYGFRPMRLTHLVIGDSVQTLPDYVFYNQDSLTSVTIGNSVTSIGGWAFRGCSGLTSVTIPNLVTSIGNYAFYGCSGLTSVTIGNSVTTIGNHAFDNCSGLTSVTIPNSVTSIGDYAFYNCSGLTSVTIGNSVTSIGGFAFRGCSGLTSVTIPNSVTSIGDCAFYNCSGLTSVTIPNSVTYIGSYAFEYCRGLTSVTIPNSVIEIGLGAFVECSGLTSVVFNAINCTTMGRYTTGFATTQYPVFSGCNNISTLTIGETVTNIPDVAFSDCSGLTSVTIPNSVTSIGGSAFSSCRGLTSVTIPNSVTSIGDYAFNNCSGLTSVTIGNSVTSIGSSAFYGCSGLTSVTMMGTVPPTLDGSVFSDNASNRKIYVPCGAYDNYYNANNGWSNYRNSLSDPIVDFDVTVNAESGKGSASIIPLRGQNVRCDSTIVVTATPNYGYHFDHWSTGSTQVQDTFAIEDGSIITAYFANNQYTINVVSDNMDMGNVFGSDTIDYLDSVTISAVANYGYHFTRWNDNDTHQVRTVQVTQNKTYTAYFDFNQYQLTVTSANLAQGSFSGSGTYNYLSNRTISATANYGYHFAHWSDGSNENPRTILLTQDTIFTAVFAKNQYAVNVVSSDTVRGYVTGSDTIDYLDSITISAVANYGYHFTRWNDNDTHQVRTVQVTQNKTYTAYFDYNQYQLTAASADTVQGTCSGSGAYSYLANRTIQATANYGYHFTQWSDGNTDNPRIIQLTQDTIFTAEFAKNQYEITLLSDDASLGSVGGGGTFDYLDTITLTATTIAEHHHFVRWSDGNRENPRQWVVSEDMILTAYFAIDTHSVTVVSNDPTRGMVTSSGSEFEYLSPCTITATAYTGFVFTGWSNGVTANPYTFAVQNDVELTAIFVSEDELMFTITVETDDPTMGSVSGGGMAMSGGEVTIHAVANEGYHFVRWNDNDTNADRTVIVTEDATYTAYFAADQTEGIDEVEQMPTIVVRGNSIAVGNAQGQKLSIYDITGRMIVREQAVDGKQYTMPHSGVYMVQVGNHPAEKVVVVR